MPRTFVIAEAGSCHEQSLEKAKKLIRAAKKCGADACKFQYWSSSKRLATNRGRPFQQKKYERCRLSKKWLPALAEYCRTVGIEFMCTAYLPEDVKVVARYVTRFKVSSFECQDTEFVAAHRPYGKPMIISTGNLSGTVDSLYPGLKSFPDAAAVYHLHCVSAYPCPLEEANLGAVPMYDGYSDHTCHEWTGAMAVAAGARIIEVHFRLDETKPDTPDYPVSHCPSGLSRYIEHIRLAETLLGNGEKEPQSCERKDS